MTADAFRARLAALSVWSRGSVRAPHKPLLVLYALGELVRGRTHLPYADVDEAVGRLLRDYGPVRQSYHPEYPFYHLQSDGLWRIEGARTLPLRTAGSSPSRRTLLEARATGGFTPEVLALLEAEPGLIAEAAFTLLGAYFPETLHEALLEDVGLGIDAFEVIGGAATTQEPLVRYVRRRARGGSRGGARPVAPGAGTRCGLERARALLDAPHALRRGGVHGLRRRACHRLRASERCWRSRACAARLPRCGTGQSTRRWRRSRRGTCRLAPARGVQRIIPLLCAGRPPSCSSDATREDDNQRARGASGRSKALN